MPVTIKIKRDPGTPEDNDEMILRNNIAMTKSCCPLEVDEGIVLIGLDDENGYLVYTYEMDESIYDIDVMNSLKDEVKSMVMEDPNDPSIRLMVSMISKTNRKGMIYRYKGNKTGKSLDVVFNTEEFLGGPLSPEP